MLNLQNEQTTVRTEVMAGITSFMTVSYIVIVNGSMLAQAGMPYEAAILATVFACLAGCLLMALWANSPLIVIPGMGDNAFFVYVLVTAFGLSWRQSLAAVLLAGIVFAAVAWSKRAIAWIQTIPSPLIHAMTAGIGLFISFLGFIKGGLVVSSPNTLVTLGHLGDPHVWTTIITLAIGLPLYLRKVPGSFLITMATGTGIGMLAGIVDLSGLSGGGVSLSRYRELLWAFDFSAASSFPFWVAVFSLSVVIVFQNMAAQLGMLPDVSKFERSFQANSASIIGAAMLGCSSTTTAAESVAGIAAGGRTGVTSLTAGLLFLPALFLIPFLKLVPDSAIAPILIIVGGLMVQKAQHIPFGDLTESFPAYLILALIPLTFSIANGIAAGFIAYPLVKIASGRRREVPATVYVVAALFVLYFVLGSL
ncbi:NCS2 family permease [Paenibacillus thalictri]|uniref:NCS2 family permease n=1 Tax=Paenibacillus thalictri TaxID=2527873 RepID=A0A4Q9DG70_9BACL|nr:NCS2 family permease [Paenibacillus thalictri]TBL71107.1 NCS2 family permease [Paenibacillus thalictri]